MLPLGLAAIGAIVGGAVAAATPQEYTATVKVFVSRTSAEPTLLDDGTSFVQQVRDSYAGVATAPLVLRSVIAKLHLHATVPQLARRITARTEDNTVLMRIDARDAVPARAAAIADAVADELAVAARSLSPSNGSSASVHITKLQPARVPVLPSSPDLPADLLIGALAGGVVGAGIALGTTAPRRRGDGRAPSMF